MTTRFRQTTVEAFASLVLLIVVLALSLLAGCLPPAPKPVDPKPDPPPVVLTPTAAAEAFGRDYSKRLAVTCQALSVRAAAGDFETLADLNDEWVNQSKADRLAAQQVLIDAMNKTLTDDAGEKPGTVAAELFEQLANGFTKGSGL